MNVSVTEAEFPDSQNRNPARTTPLARGRVMNFFFFFFFERPA